MRKILYAAMLGIILIITSCGQKNKVQQEYTTQDTETSEINSTEAISFDMAESEKQQVKSETEIPEAIANSEAKPYYGNWKITSCIGTSANYALSKQEIDDFIGAEVTYESNSYSFQENSVDVQKYQDEIETAEMFQDNFRISLSSLGFTDQEVTQVEVIAEENLFGGYFLIKDVDHLIIYYEGVFFEAVRV